MAEKIKWDCRLHWNMAFVGGIFGAYALLNRNELFGSSSTSNMIFIVMFLLGRNWKSFLLRLGAVLIYGFSMASSAFWPRYIKLDIRYGAILLDGLMFLLLAQLPADLNVILGIYPILMATGFQWCVYGGAKGYNCSTIFSTNNLKQTLLGLSNYHLNKDPAQLDKAKFYGTTILFFHLGVAFIYFGCKALGIQAAYLGLIPLVVAFLQAHHRISMDKETTDL